MSVADLPSFDIRLIPFSTRGAWTNLSTTVDWNVKTDAIHLVSHRNGIHGVLRLVPLDVADGIEWSATPAVFRWTSAGAVLAEAAYDGPDVLRLRGHGHALRIEDAVGTLTPHTGSYLFVDPVDGAAVFTSYETGRRYRIRSLGGSLDVKGGESLAESARAVVLGRDGGPWEATLEEITTAAPTAVTSSSFEQVVERAGAGFRAYVDTVAPWHDERTPAAPLAAYVLWSATVSPEGFVTRETVLMSKHWMDKLWSWDHCFNANALSEGLPDLALDQLFAPFDHLDASGAMADSVAHSEILRNYVKPPIHGWALRKLRRTLGRKMTRDELTHAYDVLGRWTTFWTEHRRAPGSVLPYYQHGNDSGWDNATTFDHDRVVESPDLAAFLVLQTEVLAGLAWELGLPGDHWTALGDKLLRHLLDELWTGDGFVAVGAHSRVPSSTSSLLRLLPIVLADRLPARVSRQLGRDVAAHLTPHGLATELPDSPHYEADGYWRGPIWAPSTALIEDGLRRSGLVELADIVNERFRGLCERSGFAENFDALTGEGLRDRAYTWTAATYLSMARDHLARLDAAAAEEAQRLPVGQ